jgi:hypothetical protein
MSVNQKTEKKQSKYKFNILDAFIILVAILCVIGIYFRSNIRSWVGADKELDEFQITFVVQKVKATSNQYISLGDKVYIQNGVEFGRIDSFSSLPAKTYVTDSNGASVEVAYPENTYIDISIVVNCRGIQNEDGFYLNGTYPITPGSVINAHTEHVDFTFTITEIVKHS